MEPNKIINYLADPSPSFVGGFAVTVVAIWLLAMIALLALATG